ncbi:alanine racemase [bacterium]|nr:alanine racemase [bacterium]
MLTTHRHTSWVEVDLDVIRSNFRSLKKFSAPAKILAVVKSEAYGHGLEAVALTLDEEEAWGFAVVNVQEAQRLRKVGITKPIVIIAPILPCQIEKAVELDLRPPVSDLQFAELVSETAVKMNKTAKVHLKVDTGMGRMSVSPEEILEFADKLRELPNLEIEGLYSHFSSADQLDQSYTRRQLEGFKYLIEGLEQKGIIIPYKHIAASAGTLLLENAKYDLTRGGIAIYGYWPSEQTRLIMKGKNADLYRLANLQLEENFNISKIDTSQYINPALSFKAVVLQTKTVPAGSAIGYGGTYICRRTTDIALIPVGYADGFSRSLSGCGEILIMGCRAPILGRVCMNLCMADITDIPGVKPGEEAVIIGRQGREYISADEVAKKIGTISYEVLTNIPMHIPRFYLGRRPDVLANLQDKE